MSSNFGVPDCWLPSDLDGEDADASFGLMFRLSSVRSESALGDWLNTKPQYGHSFGVLSHFYGREAGLELREDIDTILEENMVISMEPMILIPEGTPGSGGYREHDILVIGKDGAENITKFPFGPEHNVIKG